MMKSFMAILFASLLSSPLLANTSSMASSTTPSINSDSFASAEFDRPRRVMCIAKSGRGFRGDTFRAIGYNRRHASRNALQRCRRQSLRPFTCHIVSCRPLGRFDRD